MLATALTYGYDLGGHGKWKIAELDSDGYPALAWYDSDFYKDSNATLRAAGIDAQIVRYGDDRDGIGFILAACADVEDGPVSRPWPMVSPGPVELADYEARLALALGVLGITPTEKKSGYPAPTTAEPNWINSAYQS